MNLATAFSNSARAHRDKIAVFWGETEIRYGELHATSMAVAQHLTTQFGVQPGDRVALWLKNCPEFIPAFFGAQAAGAVVVPINNFLKPDEVGYVLRDAGAKVLITDTSMAEAFAKLTAAQPYLRMLRPCSCR